MIRQLKMQDWQSGKTRKAVETHNKEVIRIAGLRKDADKSRADAMIAPDGAKALELVNKAKSAMYDALRGEMQLCIDYEVTTFPVLQDGWKEAFDKANGVLLKAETERKSALAAAGVEIRRGSVAGTVRSTAEQNATEAIRELKNRRFLLEHVIPLVDVQAEFETLTAELQTLVGRM